MKRVKDTKNPAIKQIISMSENLREKFKKYSSVSVKTHAHTSSMDVDIEFRIYIENRKSGQFKSWPEILSFYHKLMKEKV